MELEKELKAYKEQRTIHPDEKKIRETLQKSKEVFLRCEQESVLRYPEFLALQLGLIRKRWWVLQALLLGMVSVLLPGMQDQVYMARCLGVTGVLFVVLIIPEFWKNKSCGCMQVEGACLFSLRQIYAARMLLFGLTDLFILTCFCIAVRGSVGFTAEEVLVQFLFPMLVAACICFGSLCGSARINEGTAILCCLSWSALWYVVVRNERTYAAVTFPVWCVLLGVVLLLFLGAACRTIYDCNRYWEVERNGITVD